MLTTTLPTQFILGSSSFCEKRWDSRNPCAVKSQSTGFTVRNARLRSWKICRFSLPRKPVWLRLLNARFLICVRIWRFPQSAVIIMSFGIRSRQLKTASQAQIPQDSAKVRTMIRQAYGFRDEEYMRLKIFDLPNKRVNDGIWAYFFTKRRRGTKYRLFQSWILEKEKVRN